VCAGVGIGARPPDTRSIIMGKVLAQICRVLMDRELILTVPKK
jgi:hypothetical protein